MDPLTKLFTVICDYAAQMFNSVTGPERIVLMVELTSAVVMVYWLLTKPRDTNTLEMVWSNKCATIINRVEQLMPLYSNTMAEYARFVANRVANDTSLMNMAKGIDANIKIKAERDLHVQDLANPEAIPALIMQLKSLKNP